MQKLIVNYHTANLLTPLPIGLCPHEGNVCVFSPGRLSLLILKTASSSQALTTPVERRPCSLFLRLARAFSASWRSTASSAKAACHPILYRFPGNEHSTGTSQSCCISSLLLLKHQLNEAELLFKAYGSHSYANHWGHSHPPEKELTHPNNSSREEGDSSAGARPA